MLTSADCLLRQDGVLERNLDAALATYSIGVERLMKLTLGITAVSGEGWSKKMGSTCEDRGHALDEMDGRLRFELRAAVESGDGERKKCLRSSSRTSG